MRTLAAAILCLAYSAGLEASSPADLPVDSPRDAVAISMPYAQDQLGKLNKIAAPCLARLVGNVAGDDAITALALTGSDAMNCTGPSPDPNGRAVAKVIALRPFGLNLVRIDQNFGGSFTLVRYVIVSVVVHQTPTASGVVPQLFVVRRALLANGITDDVQAHDAAAIMAEAIAR